MEGERLFVIERDYVSGTSYSLWLQAVCPSHKLPCLGCWGPVDEANVSSEFNLLKEKGFSLEEIKNRFRMHTGSSIMKPLKKLLGVL